MRGTGLLCSLDGPITPHLTKVEIFGLWIRLFGMLEEVLDKAPEKAKVDVFGKEFWRLMQIFRKRDLGTKKRRRGPLEWARHPMGGIG